jgi:Terminase large subunit, T4likevirus-type, N-terminal
MSSTSVIWQPQAGPQTALVTCPIFEVFFGGARGGGKTEGSVGDWLQHSDEWGEGANGVFFRREQQQLDEVIARTESVFGPLGAKFNRQKSTWTMPKGGRLKFRYLDRDKDAENYQGHSYTRVYIEEATNFPSFAPIKKLFGTLRSATGAHTGIRLTGNPGGPGHAWVKHRYIDPAPQGYQILKDVIEVEGFSPMTRERVYIPSRVSDNRMLMENNPEYIANLATAGSASLVRAWLLGDWSTPVGAYFTQFSRNRHVLPARFASLIPRTALRFGSFDWGYASPFSFGMWAVSDGSWGLPRGALVRYKEWYGSTGNPNEGLRLDAPMVARGILNRIGSDNLSYIAADPSVFKRDGGPSIAESFAVEGVYLRRADNARKSGWNKVREHLNGVLGEDPTPGILRPPLLYILDNCPAAINGLETVPADADDPDDVDTKSEDHAVDDIRYGVTSRPWIIDNLPPAVVSSGPTLEDLFEDAERERLPGLIT